MVSRSLKDEGGFTNDERTLGLNCRRSSWYCLSCERNGRALWTTSFNTYLYAFFHTVLEGMRRTIVLEVLIETVFTKRTVLFPGFLKPSICRCQRSTKSANNYALARNARHACFIFLVCLCLSWIVLSTKEARRDNKLRGSSTKRTLLGDSGASHILRFALGISPLSDTLLYLNMSGRDGL
jgi:hypothetical protein